MRIMKACFPLRLYSSRKPTSRNENHDDARDCAQINEMVGMDAEHSRFSLANTEPLTVASGLVYLSMRKAKTRVQTFGWSSGLTPKLLTFVLMGNVMILYDRILEDVSGRDTTPLFLK